MAPVVLLIFSVLSQLVALHYAVEDRNNTTCPAYFCNEPSVGLIRFPFKNKTVSPECGVYTVDCSNRGSPKIQLKEGGHWFAFESITQSNSVFIKDEEVEGRVKREISEQCNDEIDMFGLPSSSPMVHVSAHNLTLFKCPEDGVLDKISYRKQCRNANHTYYTNASNTSPAPHNCSIIHLPAVPDQPLYGLSSWTAEFSLQLAVTRECYECLEKRGICHNDEGKFECANIVKGKKNLKLKLGLGFGIGGAVLLVACFFILWRRYKQKHASSTFLSRNISSQPYTKSDLEGGTAYFGVSVFTYNELEEATNHFDSEKELGDGGFGTVYHGNLKDGREVAVKRLYEHNYKRVEQFMNEIEILTRLRHQNLVSLYGCTSRRSRELLLVYEYIPNGTVADHLHGDLADRGLLTWPIRMIIAIETAKALSYLHASDIVHRDVKTANILLDNNFCVKVADFGLSRLFPLDVTHVSTAPQGTPGYVDPEYHQCYQLTSKSDVYSFGVVLIELISSLPAVDITRHRQEINLSNIAINKIQRGLYSELVDSCLGFESDHDVKRMTTAVAKLAFQCLQQDNDARPTMSEVLESLHMIESGKDVPENLEEGFDDAEMGKNIQPPPSPECDELELLKNMKPPPSPSSVTQNWPSTRSSTPKASS